MTTIKLELRSSFIERNIRLIAYARNGDDITMIELREEDEAVMDAIGPLVLRDAVKFFQMSAPDAELEFSIEDTVAQQIERFGGLRQRLERAFISALTTS